MLFRWDFPAHFLLKYLLFNLTIRQNLGYNDLTRLPSTNSFELGRNLHKHDVGVASIASADALFSRREFFSLLSTKRRHLMPF